MVKEPQMTRQGTRYEPYKNSSRRRGSPPPDSWGIHAGSHHAQLNGSIFDLLEDLNTRYGSRDLRELFRDHANQTGALGQAIETWIKYDEIRGPRQPELTDLLGAQHNDQIRRIYVPEHLLGNEGRTSQPPAGQPAARNVFPPRQYSERPEAPTTHGNYLQHTSQAPRFNNTPPGERLFAGPPDSPRTHTVPTSQTIPYSHPQSATSPCANSSNHRPWCYKAVGLWEDAEPQGDAHNYRGDSSLPLALAHSPGGLIFISPHCSPSGSTGDEVPGVPTSPGQRYSTSNTRAEPHVTDSPPLSLLQLMRGVGAPPLVSLPSLGPSAIHDSAIRSEESLVNNPNEQGRISRRNSDESVHATFWETAGWTPEEGYQGFREEGYRVPTHLKGKGRARRHGPYEGGETPKEQDSSGWSPPQPGDLPYATSYLESWVSSLGGESISPEALIGIEPQDEGSIMMALHEEGRQEEHEQPRQPEPQPEPRPEPQPEHQLRRSARIKAKKQDAVPPKVKTPAKSTSRKRAVRKK